MMLLRGNLERMVRNLKVENESLKLRNGQLAARNQWLEKQVREMKLTMNRDRISG
jgi:hypothetical protein